MKKTSTLAGATTAIVLLVGGTAGGYAWGNSEDTGSAASAPITAVADRASSTAHNEQYVMFAQMMVEHHSQALDMAKLAATRAGSAQVKELAARIEAAQQPEIDMMNGWLTSWDAKPTGGMSMGHSMPGSMSAADMTSLKGKSGAAFDKAFLTMMTQHHDGAVDMARTELREGRYADALALASSIYVSQTAQVTEMQKLLK